MDRGNVKSDIEATTKALHTETVKARLPFKELNDWRYKKISVTGVYDNNKQMLLDNQVRDGVTGYNVLTPMAVEQNGKTYWILVDRGWLPQSLHRQQLPNTDIEVVQSETVLGSVYVPYADAYSLGGIADGEDNGWPRRIQFVDYQLLSDRLGVELQAFTLRLDADQKHGYRRDWAEYSMSAHKHYGYAFQWFAMAAAVFVLWLLYCIKPLMKKT